MALGCSPALWPADKSVVGLAPGDTSDIISWREKKGNDISDALESDQSALSIAGEAVCHWTMAGSE